jgi:hypothetical protein
MFAADAVVAQFDRGGDDERLVDQREHADGEGMALQAHSSAVLRVCAGARKEAVGRELATLRESRAARLAAAAHRQVSDGRHAESIALLGNYMAGSFVIIAHGHGSTLVTEALQPPKPLLTHPQA